MKSAADICAPFRGVVSSAGPGPHPASARTSPETEPGRIRRGSLRCPGFDGSRHERSMCNGATMIPAMHRHLYHPRGADQATSPTHRLIDIDCPMGHPRGPRVTVSWDKRTPVSILMQESTPGLRARSSPRARSRRPGGVVRRSAAGDQPRPRRDLVRRCGPCCGGSSVGDACARSSAAVGAGERPRRRYHASHGASRRHDERGPEAGGSSASSCTVSAGASRKFNEIDEDVWSRLRRFMVKRKRQKPPSRRGRTLDSRLLSPSIGAPPSAWRRAVPGGRVMRRPGRPPGSRVREIRTHGLNEVLLHSSATRGKGSRIDR